MLLGREGGVNRKRYADTRGISIPPKRENETAHNMPIEILGSICREANASQFPTSLNRAHPNSAKMGMQEFSYSDRKILSTRKFFVRKRVAKTGLHHSFLASAMTVDSDIIENVAALQDQERQFWN
jgi:hypothetical protein